MLQHHIQLIQIWTMKASVILPVLFLALLTNSLQGQAYSYEVSLTPINIEGLGGLQSYAVATHEGQWLLVGGRLDGLHRRQPFAAFDADGRNQDLIVVDPNEGDVWRAPLSVLPNNLAEHLASSNMQFYQEGTSLLCTGGYAFSSEVGDHITFPYLTIIDVPATIETVKNNTLSASSFTQVENEIFRVTGGALDKIDDTYYLVGGHRFMGRYNPMGPDHGPGFEQEYTHEIRKFKIDSDSNMELEVLPASHDEMHLRRRDYNLVPYLQSGTRHLMAYSGVFKPTADLPWLYPVSISPNQHEALEQFTQYFNHYHCATVPIYEADQDEMHTLFFGGIAQFYQEGDVLVQDNDVPFVNTITDLSRTSNGEMVETRLATTMPGYLGAGSVLILDDNIPLADDHIIDGSQIANEPIDIGYIYGGIRSSLPNIFWLNTGTESAANNVIYKVTIAKVNTTSTTETGAAKRHLQFYPNPASKLLRMSIDLDIAADMTVTITDSSGRLIDMQSIARSDLHIGRNIIEMREINVNFGAYYYTVASGDMVLTRKVIWAE